MSIIDPATLTVISTVSVMGGMRPHHISVSPDRSRLLVTATSADLSGGHSGGHGGSASTMIYELVVATRELRDVITVDATAHNATFSRDGTAILLGMMEHGMIAGFDANTFEESFSSSGFDMPLEVTTTGTGALLVAESGGSTVALFDLASRTTLSRFEVGATPVGAWASGTEYFVSVEGDALVRHLSEVGSAERRAAPRT